MAFSRTKHIRRYCTERRCQIRKRLTPPLKANPIKKSCKIYDMTVGEEDTTDHRPVYILGAGFSKAICDEMPLLNALGQQALNLLPKASRESISFREGESFEQWLSMRTQNMPFLPDHENMRR